MTIPLELLIAASKKKREKKSKEEQIQLEIEETPMRPIEEEKKTEETSITIDLF